MNIFMMLAVLLAFGTSLGGCTYLESALQQARLSAQFSDAPSQRVYKHMLSTDNFFVYGKIGNGVGLNQQALAVVAVSSLHQEHEVVDVSHFPGLDSFYGLNLPPGAFQLLVFSDLNHDGRYDEHEVVGGRSLFLDPAVNPEKVVGDYHIDLTPPAPPPGAGFTLQVKSQAVPAESLFYPKGSIRALDDEIFSRRMATLGMYEPAAFLEEAPMLFYALEEDIGYKVPVVFVHGIDGSPRDFTQFIARLDRRLYRPWFFFYPSGNNLSQLGEMFYNIFLSGKTMPLGKMPMVIVAHSMGGLVVREALNKLSGREGENRVVRLVTIASPLGGHPAASMASQGPVVIPSWRDVDPNSTFMHRLRRQKLPPTLENHLIYAFGNEQMVKMGENSDGVVPLSSQLSREAQEEATAQYGFNDTHTGILANPEAIERVLSIVEKIKAPYPDDHMAALMAGGYAVPLVGDYSPMGTYCIRHIGRWLDALAHGRLKPIDEYQDHFVKVCRGETSAQTPLEKDWLRFIGEYPQRIGL